MISRNVTLPELNLITGAHAMAGAGIALLLADCLKPEQRRAVGWTLLSVGILATIPLAAGLLLGHGSCNGRGKGQRESESAKE